MCEETEKHVGVYHVCEIRPSAWVRCWQHWQEEHQDHRHVIAPKARCGSQVRRQAMIQPSTQHTLPHAADTTLALLFGRNKNVKKHTHRGWTSQRETSMSHQCLSEMLQCSSNISKFMLSCNWLKISEAFNLPVAIRQPQPHCQAFTACSLSKVT